MRNFLKGVYETLLLRQNEPVFQRNNSRRNENVNCFENITLLL